MKQRGLALILLLCMLLSACGGNHGLLLPHELTQPTVTTEPMQEPSVPVITAPSVPTEPTENTEQPVIEGPFDPYEYVHYTEFVREYEPYLEQLSFDQLRYERPDAQYLIDGFTALQAQVEAGESADVLIAAHEEIYDDYLYFDTMASYAYIRYCLDLNDSYYDTEYNWCEEQSPLIEQAREKCYIAMANSPARDELEEKHFEEGFFDFYDENQIYSNDRVVALLQEQSEIEAEYMALQSDMTITWKGEERLIDELFADEGLPYSDLLEIYNLQYEKYNPLCAELYIKLIKIRKEIAAELGYDSYADFAYAYTYQRDYTPEQVEAYCDEIADEMVSLLIDALYASSSSSYMKSEETMELLAQTAKTFGGCIQMSYEFMQDYRLYDISESSSKLPGSYMTYLNSYEMPFVYISPTGTIDDFMTATHEFGHFVDGYVNCGGSASIDCAEIFSQGLEYLALSRADLDEREREALSVSKAADSAMVFLTQACYAEFEHRAFALSDAELTAEGLNELFLECNDKYGMAMLYMGMEDLLSKMWIDVQHFFVAPYYVISYCVSNDAALQIYQDELADGSGLDTYYNLLLIDRESSLLARLEAAGMTSPFAAGRIEELADFLAEQME